MKKLFTIAAVLTLIASNAFALDLNQRIDKLESKLNTRIEKIDNSRYKPERKAMLKEHAKQDTVLKIQHLKELETLKAKKKK